MDCIFCKIIEGQIPAQIIAQNENYILLLDRQPNSQGHSLVIPKKHTDNFTALTDDQAGDFARQVHNWAPQIVSLLGAEAYNLGLNNGAKAGQIVAHVHWHIIPRFAGDGLKAWERNQAEEAKLAETFALLKDKIK